MLRKQASGRFKLRGEEGQFRAVFATFNVVDDDGDVTLPGAFTEGQKTRVAQWGHNWSALPVGKGEIGANEREAWIDGEFFLETEAGRETHQIVKELGELQEWSYGYDVEDSSQGTFEGKSVRFLKRLHVHEVSPVMVGAGVGTHTVAIKGDGDLDGAARAAAELMLSRPAVQGDSESLKLRVALMALEQELEALGPKHPGVIGAQVKIAMLEMDPEPGGGISIGERFIRETMSQGHSRIWAESELDLRRNQMARLLSQQRPALPMSAHREAAGRLLEREAV